MRQVFVVCALAVFLSAFAGTAFCSARHFRTAHKHFTEFANEAAELYFKIKDNPERNVLSHLTAISAIYAEKAFLVMTLVEIRENMEVEKDRRFAAGKLADTRKFLLEILPPEIRLLTNLTKNPGDPRVGSVGRMIINEMRVFERNLKNL